MNLRLQYFILLFGLFGFVIACDDDNDFSVTPAIGFEAITGAVAESVATGKSITFYSNAKATESVTLTIALTNIGDVAYGTDYTTIPAAVDNKITVTLAPDEETPGFVVYPKIREGSPDVRKISFEITGVSGGNLTIAETEARYYLLQINKEVELKNFAFENCSGAPADFKEQIVDGAMSAATWACTSQGYSAIGVVANAYNKGDGTGSSNAYLISPVVDASTYNTLIVSMRVMSFYDANDASHGTLTLKYSSNYSGSGNPEASGVTWTELESANADIPAPASQVWTAVSDRVDGVAGKKIYFALQYKGAIKTDANEWRIDDFKVIGTK